MRKLTISASILLLGAAAIFFVATAAQEEPPSENPAANNAAPAYALEGSTGDGAIAPGFVSLPAVAIAKQGLLARGLNPTSEIVPAEQLIDSVVARFGPVSEYRLIELKASGAPPKINEARVNLDAIPSAKGPVWAFVLSGEPRFGSGGPGRPYVKDPRVVETYDVVLLNAATGDFAFRFSGQLTAEDLARETN